MKKLLLCTAILMLLVAPVNATIYSFDLDTEFSNAYEPTGEGPWFKYTIDDGNTKGTVSVTLEAINLTGQEHVKEWYFNFKSNDPNITDDAAISDLTYTSEWNSSDYTIDIGPINTLKADGDGYYDILVGFNTTKSFIQNSKATFEFEGTDIDANSFLDISEPGGGNGQWVTAVHVGGIGDEGEKSGWISGTVYTPPPAVPEPSTWLLLGTGLIGIAIFRRKSKK